MALNSVNINKNSSQLVDYSINSENQNMLYSKWLNSIEITNCDSIVSPITNYGGNVSENFDCTDAKIDLNLMCSDISRYTAKTRTVDGTMERYSKNPEGCFKGECACSVWHHIEVALGYASPNQSGEKKKLSGGNGWDNHIALENKYKSLYKILLQDGKIHNRTDFNKWYKGQECPGDICVMKSAKSTHMAIYYGGGYNCWVSDAIQDGTCGALCNGNYFEHVMVFRLRICKEKK